MQRMSVRERGCKTRHKSQSRKGEVTTSGFILVIEAAFSKGEVAERSSRSGGSDERSSQLLFIIIKFVILITKHKLFTSIKLNTVKVKFKKKRVSSEITFVIA